MSRFRESTVSNNEKKFVDECLTEFLRIDGRAFDEYRDLQIQFGKDWGSCHVALGKTQVLSQVSCEVQMPNSTRPSEGILYVNVELSPLAAPQFEPGRSSDLAVQLNRLLEKCIKDSKAIDLESLCIKVNEKVWAFHVDCNVLNDEGNIIDCVSIAALAALAHFQHPDCTCDGEEVIIHPYAQRDSISTVIHHYPVCISYAIFKNGDIILADPTLLEEQVSEASLTIGLNGYREVCGFHLAGSAMMAPEQILQTTHRAANRANLVIAAIKQTLAADAEARKLGADTGFETSYLFEEATYSNRVGIMEHLSSWRMKASKKRVHEREQTASTIAMKKKLAPAVVERISKQNAALLPPHTIGSVGYLRCDSEDEDSKNETMMKSDVITEIKKATPLNQSKQRISMDTSDSEEETTIVLNADKITKKAKGRRK